jgi:hypothetical protein
MRAFARFVSLGYNDFTRRSSYRIFHLASSNFSRTEKVNEHQVFESFIDDEAYSTTPGIMQAHGNLD